MTTRRRTTFEVRHVYRITVDIGELPEHAIAALLEKDLSDTAPAVFLAGTDWSVGEGGDRGTGSVVSVDVEPLKEEDK